MARILIADDDGAIRAAIRGVLEEEGFTCLEAANGEDALSQLRSNTEPLVLLLDLMVPRIGGLEVLGAVDADRRLAARHAVIMLTASGRPLPLALVRMMDRLDVPLLAKPLDMDRLVEVVRVAAKRLEGRGNAGGRRASPHAG